MGFLIVHLFPVQVLLKTLFDTLPLYLLKAHNIWQVIDVLEKSMLRTYNIPIIGEFLSIGSALNS